ncbi:MAG: serine/threonine-protein kinase [Gammaproteobacteria bacterium]|nr:serine/threonine-protein kinase [Gammaproteobacteria bacterium]
MSNIPKKLGKYEIVREIGRGNMGSVYLANDNFNHREVAVKVAHPRFFKDAHNAERNRKMLFNEASASSFIDHPNIVHIYDADVENDMFYLVMEYVANARTLAEFARPDKLLPINFVIELIYKISKALDHAHRRGVTHRDIKPSNLLLTKDKDVKVTDYGIALINREDYSQTQVDGVVIGTPAYMSPEQISTNTVTYATDVFSLGIVAYQLITGVNPFHGDNFQAIYKRINYEQQKPLSEYRSDLPEGIDIVVKKMLRKEVDQRYRTALDVAADLSVVVDVLTPTKGETGLQERFEIARGLAFFKEFEDAEIWEFLRSFEWKNVPRGTTIIKENEVDDGFFVLAKGVVGVTKNDMVIERIQEGNCFGEMGYVSGAKRSASITADSDVSMIRVNAQLIERASTECQNRFLKVFVKTLTGRLSETTTALVNQQLV